MHVQSMRIGGAYLGEGDWQRGEEMSRAWRRSRARTIIYCPRCRHSASTRQRNEEHRRGSVDYPSVTVRRAGHAAHSSTVHRCYHGFPPGISGSTLSRGSSPVPTPSLGAVVLEAEATIDHELHGPRGKDGRDGRGRGRDTDKSQDIDRCASCEMQMPDQGCCGRLQPQHPGTKVTSATCGVSPVGMRCFRPLLSSPLSLLYRSRKT
jgi:hypothetical protein